MKNAPPPAGRRRFLVSLAAAALATRASAASAASAPVMEVWKEASCGCCGDWIPLMRAAGFNVVAHDGGAERARAKAGVADTFASCHTALVGGYAIEGHVPTRDIHRLLKERPSAIGLSVPGMVNGSPGMEQRGLRPGYAVLLLHRDGGSSVFARYPAQAPLP
jgi:hypothetical protein